MFALPQPSQDQYIVEIANSYHVVYAQQIAEMIAEANQEPGVVLALRTIKYLSQAMKKGHAAIAFDALGDVIGFCVIKLWDEGRFISNSGLIVKPRYRKLGIGTAIIQKLNDLCSKKYAKATLFSLTDSQMVIKTRLAMGFEDVPFGKTTQDPIFWAGCKTCPHYDVFVENKGKKCKCKVLIKKPAVSE